MRGCQGGVRGCRGAYMVGGMCGCRGACVVVGGMCGCQGGMHGCRGAVVIAGGVHGCQGVRRIRRDTVNERAVRILLECILV